MMYWNAIRIFWNVIRNPHFNQNDMSLSPMILSIISNYETNIIFTRDSEDTAKYLITLAKQQLKPKTKISLCKGKTSRLKEVFVQDLSLFEIKEKIVN